MLFHSSCTRTAFTNAVTGCRLASRGLMGIQDDSTLMWFLFICIAVLIVLGVLGWLFG